MTGKDPVKISLMHYPGVQMSAVLGLADLFGIANNLVRRRSRPDLLPLLRIDQLDWQSGSIF